MPTGSDTYTRADQLPPLPAATNDLTNLHWPITEPGAILSPDTFSTLLDPVSRLHVGDLIEHAAEQARDTLIVR